MHLLCYNERKIGEYMKRLKKIIELTLPVCLGYIPLGIAFGVLLSEAGYGGWWSLLISGTIYAGSMQFVLVALLSSNVSLVSCALLTFLVQSRHLFYGLSLIERYKKYPLLKRIYLIFSLTDETYSLMTSLKNQEEFEDDSFLFQISFINQCYWVLGSVIGSALGNVIPFDTTGIDFVMTALFVTIVTDQYNNTKNHVPFWTGCICGILCLLVFGADQFLIAALILSVVILSVRKEEVSS